jgi:4-diphosphocytidyl-2-C-methyl-D-erythritol kinase
VSGLFYREEASFAKINLHLAIGAKRADGFHDIESIFLPVSLCDRIAFWHSAAETFSVTITGMNSADPPVPLEKNVMYRAAKLFYEKTRSPFSLRIVIEKNIPLGAGLGGGSSNAAAVLRVLNEAAGFPVSRGVLLEMAAALGSDIPFFIEGRPAFVSGRGENIEPCVIRKAFPLVLIKPAFASDTAGAYRLLDKNPRRRPGKTPPVAALNGPPAEWPYANDFQSVFLDNAYPHAEEYTKMFSCLAGAQFRSLSGSGSTVFGVYPDAGTAFQAAETIKTSAPARSWRVFLCETRAG